MFNVNKSNTKIFSNLWPNISFEAKIDAWPTFEAWPKICLGTTLEPKLRPGQL